MRVREVEYSMYETTDDLLIFHLEIHGVSGSRIDASGMPGGSPILPLVDHEAFWEIIFMIKATHPLSAKREY
jgi:hypothetical protein